VRLDTLSYSSRLAFAAIAEGKKLRVPRDGSPARLVDPPIHDQTYGQVPIDRAVVLELLKSGLVHKLSRWGHGDRLGWVALGFTDGDVADYYCCEV